MMRGYNSLKLAKELITLITPVFFHAFVVRLLSVNEA
jgi:hypothetical protein